MQIVGKLDIQSHFATRNQEQENINKCTLVGSTNEVSVTIDNYQTTARVDTGSSISTIRQSFY